MTNTTLEKFLEENDKLPKDSQLSSDKIMILKIASKWCSKIYRIGEGQNKKWRFCFDDGAYQGEYQCDILQKNLSPLALLNVIDSINWPGFKIMVEMCNQKIIEVIKV